jgi:hypothetical protein
MIEVLKTIGLVALLSYCSTFVFLGFLFFCSFIVGLSTAVCRGQSLMDLMRDQR